jgi:hypothetical protein
MFENIEVTKFISDMLTPAVMLSVCALFLLGLQNKFSNIITRLRELTEERRELKLQDQPNKFQQSRLSSIEKQISGLLNRARLDKDSILSIYAGMIFFLLVSLSIAVKDLGWILNCGIITLILFLIGTAFVFIGTVCAYLEVRISYRVVQFEVEEHK